MFEQEDVVISSRRPARVGEPRRWLRGTAVLLLAGGLLLWLGQSIVAAGTVYSVEQVRDRLARDPGARVGQVVRVSGMLLSTLLLDRRAHFPKIWLLVDRSPRVATATLRYLDGSFTTIYGTRPSDIRSRFVLRLVPGQPDAVMAALRHLPFAWLLPAPQASSAPQFAGVAYMVQLARAPPWLCGAPPCYQGVVQDSDPDSWR